MHNVENILHLESDNMLYFAADDFRDAFSLLNSVATTFGNNERAVPGIVCIKNAGVANTLGL